MQHLASRQSLELSTQGLLAVAANLDDAGLRALGADLGAVGRLLEHELTLRRSAADSSVPASSRAELLRRLLSGRVGASAIRVVDQVASADWSTGRDLTDAFGRLSRTAMFLRAERAGELDRVEDEIFRFGRILVANPGLSSVLDDRNGLADARVAVVNRLLGDGKAHPLTVEMLTALAANTGGRSFSHGVDRLVEEAAQRKDKVVAVVTSPVELTAAQADALTASLARIYRRPVVTHVQVDPDLLGGLLVKVGDEVIDGSVAGRLAQVRSRLAS